MTRWRDVPGFPDYQASTDGKVRSKDRWIAGARSGALRFRKGALMTGQLNNKGYRLVSLIRDGRRRVLLVHRVILATFRDLDLDDPLQIGMHRDDNKVNNKLTNLRIGTTRDNVQDKVSKGRAVGNQKTYRKGSSNPASVLTEASVRKIDKLIRKGLANKDIGPMFGIGPGLVSTIRTGARWSHITGRTPK